MPRDLGPDVSSQPGGSFERPDSQRPNSETAIRLVWNSAPQTRALESHPQSLLKYRFPGATPEVLIPQVGEAPRNLHFPQLPGDADPAPGRAGQERVENPPGDLTGGGG